MTIIGLIVCLLSLFSTGAFAGTRCEQESHYGFITSFECPRPYDEPSAVFCCGSIRNGQCCIYGLDDDDIKDFPKKETKSERKKRENFPIEFNRVLVAGRPYGMNEFQTKDVSDYDKHYPLLYDPYQHASNSFHITEYDNEGPPNMLPEIIGGLFAVVLVVIVVCCCCCPFCLLYKRRQRGIVHNPPQNQPQVVVQQQPYVPVHSNSPYPIQQYSTQVYTQAVPAQGYPQAAPAPYPVAQPPHPMGDNPPPYDDKQMAFNPNY